MHRTRATTWSLGVLVLLSAGLAGTGCVASQKTAYARHLDATIEPGQGATDDVAIAFNLGKYASPVLAHRSADGQPR